MQDAIFPTAAVLLLSFSGTIEAWQCNVQLSKQFNGLVSAEGSHPNLNFRLLVTESAAAGSGSESGGAAGLSRV